MKNLPFGYKKTLNNFLESMVKPDVWLFFVATIGFHLIYTWSLINVDDAGWPLSFIMYLGVARTGAVALLLYITTSGHYPAWLPERFLVLGLMAMAMISSVLLSVLGFTQVGWIALFALVSLAHVATFSLRILASSTLLPRIQAEDGKNIKLALIMMATPVLVALIMAASGYLAEINLVGPLLLGCVIYGGIVFNPKIIKNMPDLKIRSKAEKHADAPPCLAAVAMFVLAGAMNSFSMIIKWVITPLYLWEGTDHDPKKLGMILGVLALVVLLARLIKNEAKNQHFSGHNVMIAGAIFYGAVLIGWGLAESVFVGAFFIALREVGSVIFTYGYLVKLEYLQPKIYSINFRTWMYTSYGASAVGFLLMALSGVEGIRYLSLWLIGLGVLKITIVMVYQMLCYVVPRIKHPDPIS